MLKRRPSPSFPTSWLASRLLVLRISLFSQTIGSGPLDSTQRPNDKDRRRRWYDGKSGFVLTESRKCPRFYSACFPYQNLQVRPSVFDGWICSSDELSSSQRPPNINFRFDKPEQAEWLGGLEGKEREIHLSPSDDVPFWQRCRRSSFSAVGSCLAKDIASGGINDAWVDQDDTYSREDIGRYR